MRQIMMVTDTIGEFTQMLHSNVPYNIPQLNVRGKIPSNGTIVGYSEEMNNHLSVPLIILSVRALYSY